MKYDTTTGEPAKGRELYQERDTEPVPPYGCIKIIWYKDNTELPLDCVGVNADFICMSNMYSYTYVDMILVTLNQT